MRYAFINWRCDGINGLKDNDFKELTLSKEDQIQINKWLSNEECDILSEEEIEERKLEMD